MSIIQKIRDKAAWLVFGLIALSLVGFLLMDAFVGRSRLFGGPSTTVGSVDGEKLDYTSFQKQISAREEQYKAQGYAVNEMMQQNIKDNVWKDFVENTLLEDVYKKSGIDVSDKEVSDMLTGPNAIPEIRRSFTDPKTGIFDAALAATNINQLRTIYFGNRTTDRNYEQARRFFEEGIPQIVKARQREKYLSLLATSSYIPKWMMEKEIADNNQIASISYVAVPYATVSDSVARVTDEEISQYVANHKDQFKTPESRSVAYATFSAAPTAGDTAKIRKAVGDLKNEFAQAKDNASFLARVESDLEFADIYVSKSKIQVPNKDSIMALSKGATFGPYLDAGNWVLAKMLDQKLMPDSTRARHILVATADPQSGQPLLDDSSAHRKIDSIKALVDKGVRFDSLAVKLSDDGGSKIKGGDLGYFSQGTMVKEFNDFCFSGKAGEQKIVKTQFGYHLIEILDQKNFEPAYKVAYLAKKIEASTETDDAARGLATQFAGNSRGAKAFDENLQKSHLQKLLAPDILPTDYMIQGLGESRTLVRWINDASVGDVSEPFKVGDLYVVALLTDINAEGIKSAAKARPQVEPMLRNQKKADQIAKKIGTPASLDAAAAASGQRIQRADSISFSTPYIANVGQEARVVGAAFNKEWLGKPVSSLISGNTAVYIIKVENVGAKSNISAGLDALKKSREQNLAAIIQREAVEDLKKQAAIKDARGKFY